MPKRDKSPVRGHPGSGEKGKDLPPSAGFIIECDVPMKQYIVYLNQLKPVDKKFIIQDLDAEHLLVKAKCRDEVMKKVNEWMDENVFSSVERVGEDLDLN